MRATVQKAFLSLSFFFTNGLVASEVECDGETRVLGQEHAVEG